MVKLILYAVAIICSIMYNIMAIGSYALYKNDEFKKICLFFIITNMVKDTVLFSIVLSNIFLR